jgi:hypothetical protein
LLNLAKVFIYRSFSSSSNKLNPWFVSGLIDSEGCFNISISETLKRSKIGWIVQARFILELHIKDLDLLLKLKSFFGEKGNITTSGKVARYSIVGLNDIINFVLPHLFNYPLQSAKKKIDFEL